MLTRFVNTHCEFFFRICCLYIIQRISSKKPRSAANKPRLILCIELLLRIILVVIYKLIKKVHFKDFLSLVVEQAHTCKRHCYSVFVAGFNNKIVTDRTAGFGNV